MDMDNEYAIMVIQAIPNKIWNQLDKCECEAMEMAIKSLEKQIKIKEVIGSFQNDMYDDEIAELFFKIKELVS